MPDDQRSTIKVAALTSGHRTPSSRFRIRQYIPLLAQRGVKVDEHIPRFGTSCGLPSPFKMASRLPALVQSHQADLTWLSRYMVQGYAFFERSLKRPRVLDVDDAVWLNPPLGRLAQPWIARGMDAVLAGNAYLAAYYRRFCPNVHIIPTAIDTEKYRLRELPADEPEPFTLVWTGLAVNYTYLDLIAKPLRRFLQDFPRARLLLIANRPWKQETIPANRIHFEQWSPDIEAEALRTASVGLMPLADDPWTQGKCSFKMLQYMAVGLPAVVSPVGMNRDVLAQGDAGLSAQSDDDWYDALRNLHDNYALQGEMGRAGRAVIEKSYNSRTVVDRIAGIFRSLL